MANGDILSIGASGLRAFQRTLAAIGHNVSNVNTDGYSRQRVELTENYPNPQANGFIGTGVKIVTTKRMFDEMAHKQLQFRTSTYNNYETYLSMSEQVDNLLADSAAGLSPAIQSFFDAVQKVADDPTSMPARNVLLTDAKALIDRFHSTEQVFSDLRVAVNNRMQGIVGQINTLTSEIASANNDIIVAAGLAHNQPPNDLLDKRDQLILDLSKIIGIKTLKQDDGSINVFIGNGQSLVLGTRYTDLYASPNPNDPLFKDVFYSPTAAISPVNISTFLRDGDLGGLIAFREEVLLPAMNEVGRTAIAISETFNAQHALGMDLNNELGGQFFTSYLSTTSVPWVAKDVNNASLTSVTANLNAITAAANLTAHDYKLVYDGTNFSMVDLTTNAVSSLVLAPPPPSVATLTDVAGLGFDITIDTTGGMPAAGDSWYIRPTRLATRDIALAINDPRKIAAADPVRTLAGKTNLGDGLISLATILDITQPLFAPPPIPPGFNLIPLSPDAVGNMRIRFVAGGNYIVENPITGLPIPGGGVPMPYTSGTVIPLPPGAAITPLNVTITGTPLEGDYFDVEYNTGGFSDNRNAKALSALQSTQMMVGGTASFQEAYSQLVVKIGNFTRNAQTNASAQEALVSQASDLVQSISGVNLDEEAANMVRFQQAYSAAAQVIAASNSVFQTLMSVVSR